MDQSIFKKRRKEFLRRIAEAGGGLVILAAGTEQERNPEVNYEFRQESNFYYLTGLEQPDAIAVFDPRSRKPYTLFVHPRDPKKELWLGPSVGPDEAVKHYGADQGEALENIESRIKNYGGGTATLWHHFGSRSDVDEIVHQCLKELQKKQRSGIQAPDTIRDPFPMIAGMRLRKSLSEIAALQKAIDVTAQGFAECFKMVRPGLKEYQLRATLEYAFRRKGAVRHGYAPIVASGSGTCVLHNPHDRTTIKKNSLVLIDSGAEWEYYSADITRTFPASGTFTNEQRTVYDIVLETQERAIAMVKPGVLLKDIEEKTREFMIKALLKKKVIMTEKQVFLPHRLGHWLGMDVHDVGRYDIPFEPGMVLTIEPGIYLNKSKEINRDYWGIGIRIEDDILVTRSGHQDLSERIPKDPDDLERIIHKAQS